MIAERGRSICTMDGCDAFVHAHGLCEAHDRRKRLYGDPGPATRRRWRRTEIKVGDVFGRWTALSSSQSSLDLVLCRCQCGTERKVMARGLVTGNSQSCGCRRQRPQARTVPYMVAGTTSGRLTAMEDAWRASDRIRFRCECGTESSRTAVSVGSGPVKSCGCLQSEVRLKHGLSQHPLYATWKAMISRTTNPGAHNYPIYGGRGITVCDNWSNPRDGLQNFIADVGARPSMHHTLDRIDNDGNYEPGNVKWSTKSEQRANQRSIAALTAERDALVALLAAARAS